MFAEKKMNIEYLIKLKNELHLTYEELSEKSGVPESTLIRIFNGKTESPYYQTIEDIVKAMGGSLDEMSGINKSEAKSKEVRIDVFVKIL